MQLNKEILKQMRSADSIQLGHDDTEKEPKGYITLGKKVKVEGYKEETIYKSFYIESDIKNQTDKEQYKRATYLKFIYCQGKDFEDSWRSQNNYLETMLCMLKDGDDIKLSWYPDAGSITIEDAGLTMDMLILRVQRGNKHLSFCIDKRVTTKNSSIRMIRH